MILEILNTALNVAATVSFCILLAMVILSTIYGLVLLAERFHDWYVDVYMDKIIKEHLNKVRNHVFDEEA